MLYSQNVKSGGIYQNISTGFARGIVLYPHSQNDGAAVTLCPVIRTSDVRRLHAVGARSAGRRWCRRADCDVR